MRPISISAYFDTLSKSQRVYARFLEPVCRNWDLTRSELDVLLFLYNNPEFDRAADIAAHRGMAKSHVSASVAGLERRQLLVRSASASDRRAVRLKLTPQAIRIAETGRQAQQTFFEQLYAGLDPQQLQLWETITNKVRRNIEDLDRG